jgi:formylglycine-generating enzyme required for sulfatase activity
MTGKEAVYYDSTGTILLRDATVLGTVNGATQQDRNGYRLPKEKEWEYAARGGVPSDATGSAWKYSYAGSNTIDDVAWYNITANSKTHPVREKSANSAGLYDMSGNVWEWCFDPSGGGYRVARGGGWDVSPSNCLVAYRQEYFSSGSAFVTQGFRLVCR